MSAEITSAAELKYLESTAALDLLCKEEDLRRGRLRSLLLSDELDESNDKLFQEAERADLAEYDALYWQDLSSEYQRRIELDDGETRTRVREMESLRAELASLHSISADSKSLLTEKLSLARDVAIMKPELDHLRSQASSNEKLFAEKLSLQHDLSICQAELEESRRSLQRLQAKQGQTSEPDMQLESEIKQLRTELAKEKRERAREERAAADNADDLRKELAKEKRERENAEKTASKTAVGDIDELADLKKDLAAEKRERIKAEKLVAQSNANWEAQKSVLNDKLDQFRSKLRSTKESLRETQEELEQAQQKTVSVAPQSKPSRKRSAAQMDPDATIGTPGDAAPNKRSKRASSIALGEKSTFSITPFLSRTTSVAPESPKSDAGHDTDGPVPTIEITGSPTAHLVNPTTKAAGPKKVTPLAPSSPGKSNVKIAPSKPAPRKKAAATLTLEKVTEEGDTNIDVGDVNGEHTPLQPAAPAADTAKTDSKIDKPARLSLKPKSLSSFATFRDGSLPPQPLQKKKRKLLGGGGGGRAKTLFDDEEDGEGEEGEQDAVKGTASLGGQRAFGAFGGGRSFGGLGILGGAKKKGPLVVAKDGFMFSPLKKDRKAMAVAAAVTAGEA